MIIEKKKRMSASVIRPAGAAYAPRAAPSALVQGDSRDKRSKRDKRSHHHHHAAQQDQWDCADLLDKSRAKKRVFFWQADGSLRSMSGKTYHEAPLTIAHAVMFRAATDPPQSERKGDPTRAILLDGCFRSVTNRFPVTMVLSSNGLNGRMYGAARGESVERGLLIVPGNRTIDFVGEDGRFMLPHPSLMSDVVRRFAKDSHRDLLGECIEMKDTGNYMVPADSPIMHIIGSNEAVIRENWPGFAVRKLDTIDGKYLLPGEYVLESVEVFNKAIKTRMPHVDMTKLTLRLSRYNADWTDAIVPDTNDRNLNDRLLDMYASFSVALELTYRLPIPNA